MFELVFINTERKWVVFVAIEKLSGITEICDKFRDKMAGEYLQYFDLYNAISTIIIKQRG